ncbi:MAG TPA: type 4a pilus biogenesis protein PilO [bacterium]|nr:type 4a pilus biogenesis protein PilO [bacterium]
MLKNSIKKENDFNFNSFNESSEELKLSQNINISTKPVSRYILVLSKYIKILIILEIVLVFFVSYFYLIKPKFNQLLNSIAVLKDKNVELETVIDYQNKFIDLQNSYNKIENKNKGDIQKLRDILPEDKYLPELMAQVEALAIDQGLVLANITIDSSSNVKSSPDENETKGSSDIIREIQVSINILGGNGTYDKVKEFLKAMESHIRLIDIMSFSFDEKMTAYSIVFKTYFLQKQ